MSDPLDGVLWRVDQGDVISWLDGLPAQSADLIFGSPPYVSCRLYLENGENLGIARNAEQWAAWILDVFKASLRVCKGLVAFVVEGQTKSYRWDAAPALLMADLHRAGIHLRKPPIYRRVGIPGSGGPDWLRNDCEFVICATNGGKLPWSDNTALGHPPKWAPGGEMSHRLADGQRVNQWGMRMRKDGSLTATDPSLSEDKPRSRKPFHITLTKRHTKRQLNGTMEDQVYVPPAIANPGNVIDAPLTLVELSYILTDYGTQNHSTADQVLRELWRANSTGHLYEWLYGVCLSIRASSFLQSSMCGGVTEEIRPGHPVPGVRQDDSEAEGRIGAGVPGEEVLLPQVSREGDRSAERAEARRFAAQGQEGGASNDASSGLREVRQDESPAHSPSGRRRHQQRPEQSSGSLPLVSSEGTQAHVLQCSRMQEALLRSGLLQSSLSAIQEAWRCVAPLLWQGHESAQSSNLIHCIVGGGSMGNRLVHANEAGFPERLAEFFIRSFCPENGICIDPFSGSGTTAAVAVRWGRRALACDLRQSQVELSRRRIKEAEPSLFSSLGD